MVKGQQSSHAEEGIGHHHASIVIEQRHQSLLPHMTAHRLLHNLHIVVPPRNQFGKRVIVDETNVEIVAAHIDDGLNGHK